MKQKYLSIIAILLLTSCGSTTSDASSSSQNIISSKEDISSIVSSSISASSVFSSSSTFSKTHTHIFQAKQGFLYYCSEKGEVPFYYCSSCDTYFDENKQEVNIFKDHYDINEWVATKPFFSHDYETHFNSETEAKIDKMYQTVKADILSESKSISYIAAGYNEFYNGVSILNSDIAIYSLMARTYSGELSDAYRKKQSDAYDLFIKEYDNFMDVLETAAHTKYKSDFFGNKTDEEIENYLHGQESDVSLEIGRLNNQIDQLRAAYNNSENKKTIAEAFLEIKPLLERQAELAGYDYYPDYAYDYLYDRAYAPDKINDLKPILKKYIVPMFEDVYLKEEEVNDILMQDAEKYENIYRQLRVAFYKDPYIEDFYEKVGGIVKQSYDKFKKEGTIFFSNSIRTDETAFCGYSTALDEAYIWLQPSLCAADDFVHEFGHYIDFTTTNFADQDINETLSTSCELLYESYALDIEMEDKFVKDTQLDSIYWDLMTNMSSPIETYLGYEVEKYAFTHDSFTQEDIQNIYNQAAAEIGADFYYANSKYWEYYLYFNTCYMPSYGMSALGALKVLALARNDFDSAKALVNKLFDKKNADKNFSELYEAVGLGDVFSESYYDVFADVNF